MKYCRQCGSQLADEAKFCASCGTAVIEPAQPEKAEVKAVEKQVMVETKIEDTTQPEMFQQFSEWKDPARPRVPFLANPIFLGILFIVSGLCMLLLPTMPVMDLTEAGMYGSTYVASVTVANNVISGFESFAFQAPALIAIVTGIVLMQKRRGAFKLAMLGGISSCWQRQARF
ncbi:MAG: zinc ribbon domain-containing protein [Firmicutes bacterium]|nr:zinc ribbon domain-containing protein [Bacillota bacterium]